MTKGRKTGGKDFTPGNKVSQGKGRPPLPEDVKQGRKINQTELERVINKLLYVDRAGLQEIIKTPDIPMIEIIAASILAQAAQKGDHVRLEFILQRMIGKVKDQLEVTMPKPFIVQRLDGTIIEMGAALPKKEGE